MARRRVRLVPAMLLALALTAFGADAAGAATPTASPTPTATRSATPGATRTATPSATPTAAAPSPSPTPTLTTPAGTKLAVAITGDDLLTLPAGDGFHDSTKVRVLSGAAGDVDLIAKAGKQTVVLAAAAHLKRTRLGWGGTLKIDVKSLTAGMWTLTVRRTDDEHVHARAAQKLPVGSGRAVAVYVTPVARTLYPYKDGTLDRLTTVVVAKDETGTSLPVHGTSVLSYSVAGVKKHKPTTTTKRRLDTLLPSVVESDAGSIQQGTSVISVVGLPLGAATLTTTLQGPAGDPKIVTMPITLAPTGVGTLRLAESSDTVQPVVDGLLDTVTFTPSGTASANAPVPLTGSIVLRQGAAVVATWPVTNAMTPVTWDGRVNGAIVPGTYTATLTLSGPQGAPKSTSTTVLVSAAHLPYRVRDLFTVSAGNQQGLAVHNGVSYVGYDNGDGTADIEEYNSSGVQLPSGLNNLPIGHAAELAFSTTTNLLYAANGGPNTPTKVWPINPGAPDGPSAVQAPYDLSSLGPNGMVAVDDAASRLIVFAGTPGAYTISSVSLTDVTDPNGGPAGTVLSTTPIAITGVPQGIDVVGTQLWVYTSLKKSNHMATYDISNPAVVAPGTGAIGSFDLMNSGEGEGLAIDSSSNPSNGLPAWIYVGTHSVNRIGVLEPVPDA